MRGWEFGKLRSWMESWELGKLGGWEVRMLQGWQFNEEIRPAGCVLAGGGRKLINN